MKKKVLFYGNCQLAVLSRMLDVQTPKFNEQYEILKASDYNLANIWREDALVVAAFQYQSHTEYGCATDETLKSIEKIIDDADIIIFQKLHEAKHINRPIELTTDYIYDKYHSTKQMICVPSFWFSGYLSESYVPDVAMPYIFIWLLERGFNNEQILDWLKNNSDPKITAVLAHNINSSFEELKRREADESSKYECFISILDIVPQYKENVLCYNHSHPSEYYFKALYKKLIDVLDETLYNNINKTDIELVGSFFHPFPLDLCYFRENFPDISGCSDKHYGASVDIDFVNKQVELLKTLTERDIQRIKPLLDILNS